MQGEKGTMEFQGFDGKLGVFKDYLNNPDFKDLFDRGIKHVVSGKGSDMKKLMETVPQKETGSLGGAFFYQIMSRKY